MQGGTSLSRDLNALTDTYRRHLLLALAESEPQAADDPDPLGAPEGARPTDAGVTTLTIRHVHLPTLVEGGYVDWDRSTGSVRRGPEWERVERLLESLDSPGVGPGVYSG